MATARGIGESLVEYAKKEADFTARRGLVGDLFPYIWTASKRMSVRAIAKWLQEAHGVTLSANTIARGLRKEDEHWMELAERVVAGARPVEKRSKEPVLAILRMRDIEEFEKRCVTNLNKYRFSTPEPTITEANLFTAEYEAAVMGVEILLNDWFALPSEARERCMPYVTLALGGVEAERSKKK